ncbi:thymidine kinase [Niastella koreensis]|uniref:Thymidine kinase n=2 Tax=Niastella koreensis TaxID=354356 RepID=G8T9S6_NIAKG|nr:thymidine kinase [Niastella koreensis]AEW01270.1 Thymidine kinase [Niastella koreensis GR20-10]OQP46394.1 thymidine kinase [Niastella koreensis]
MFIEPNISGERRGSIEVICGSMFSGKTEELIRRLKRAKIANLRVEIFKPKIDVRYDVHNIVSHDENAILSTPIDNSQTILLLHNEADVIGIDEAQFFDDQLPDVCDQLALRGHRVIVAGLDMDYTGKPFGQIPFLLSKADYITKLHAICVKCGHIANYSFRKKADKTQVLLGEKDVYEPRCRKCYYEGAVENG